MAHPGARESPRNGAAGAWRSGPARSDTGPVVAFDLPRIHGEVVVGEAAVAAAVECHAERTDVCVLREDPSERHELGGRGVADWPTTSAARPPGPAWRVVFPFPVRWCAAFFPPGTIQGCFCTARCCAPIGPDAEGWSPPVCTQRPGQCRRGAHRRRVGGGFASSGRACCTCRRRPRVRRRQFPRWRVVGWWRNTVSARGVLPGACEHNGWRLVASRCQARRGPAGICGVLW